MRLSGILFDKDGTLVDLEATWGGATRAAMRRLAGRDEALSRQLADALHYDLATERFATDSAMMSGTLPTLYGAFGAGLGRPLDAALTAELTDIFATETLATLLPIGDPAAVLAELRDMGLALGLATNDGEANARTHLAKLGLDGHLDFFVAGYDSGHGGKPEPGMVLAFAAKLGVPPERVALVGDTLHDMGAARAAGAVGIAVLSGPLGRDVLGPAADHVIDSVADLPALMRRLN